MVPQTITKMVRELLTFHSQGTRGSRVAMAENYGVESMWSTIVGGGETCYRVDGRMNAT